MSPPSVEARIRRPSLPLIATCVVVLGCSAPSTAFGANARPDATFAAFPAEPFAGQTVRFVSYGCDPDGRVTKQAWDLDGDGIFDDAFGPSASRAFQPGSRAVGLRVTDDEGTSNVRRRILTVGAGRPEYVVPRPSLTPLLSPFPLIRLVGRVTSSTTRIRVLSVRAPVCSRVTVRCRGPSCPMRRSTRLMGRKRMRFRGFERRLRAGARLEVLVSKRDRIGRFTRFRIRPGRPPDRLDLCLRFRATRGSRCPDN